jgi:hypothetical protein
MPEPIGQVDPEIYKKFLNSQNTISALSQQIGLIEVKKAELIRLIEKESESTSSLMRSEAIRLQIPDGQDWHVDKDGTAFLGRAPENNTK